MEIDRAFKYTLEKYHYEPYSFSYSFSLALSIGIILSYYLGDIASQFNTEKLRFINAYPIIFLFIFLLIAKFVLHYYCRCNYDHSSRFYYFACYLTVPIVFCVGFLRMNYYQNSLLAYNKELWENYKKIAKVKDGKNLDSIKSIRDEFVNKNTCKTVDDKQLFLNLKGRVKRLEIGDKRSKFELTEVVVWYKYKKMKFPNISLSVANKHIAYAKQDFAILESKIVSLNACVYRPAKPIIKGSYNVRKILLWRNILLTGFSTGNVMLRSEKSSIAASWRSFLCSKIISCAYPTKAILLALITGKKSLISKETKETYAKAGISHVLAVSGLHMATLAMIASFFCYLFLALFPFFGRKFDTRRFVACFVILILTLYLIMCGSAISAQRAYIMSISLIFSLLFYTHYKSMQAVNIAAIIILMLNPMAVFNISFQLSFAAVIALIKTYEFVSGWFIDSFTEGFSKRNFFLI